MCHHIYVRTPVRGGRCEQFPHSRGLLQRKRQVGRRFHPHHTQTQRMTLQKANSMGVSTCYEIHITPLFHPNWVHKVMWRVMGKRWKIVIQALLSWMDHNYHPLYSKITVCCVLMHVCISIEMSLLKCIDQLVVVYTFRLMSIEMHTCMSRQQ